MTEIAKPLAHVWSSDALLLKARRYVEEMQKQNYDEWQFAFWSSLALELLARAALAKTHPALLADDDWTQLYFALGHTPFSAKFTPKSISISEVLSRLKLIDPTFDNELRDFCAIHTGMRNAELHSAAMPFENMKQAWLGDFYRACEVLCKPLGLTLIDLLGQREADAAKQQIKARKDEAAKAVVGTIKSYKTVWENKTAEEQNSLKLKAKAWALRQDGHVVKCPACQCEALLDGDAMDVPKKSFKDEMIVETQVMLPSQFRCAACNLKISGLSQLTVAQLGAPFKTTSTYDPAEFYADEDEGRYEDDNNEPV